MVIPAQVSNDSSHQKVKRKLNVVKRLCAGPFQSHRQRVTWGSYRERAPERAGVRILLPRGFLTSRNRARTK